MGRIFFINQNYCCLAGFCEDGFTQVTTLSGRNDFEIDFTPSPIVSNHLHDVEDLLLRI